MKTIIATAICLLILVPVQTAFSKDVERTKEVQKTLHFGDGSDRLVAINNVWGSIDVTGYDGDDVLVTIHKRIVARSERKADLAEEVISLDITEEDDFIELYVDGPFRRRNRDGVNWEGSGHHGYKVIYDFELKVPRDCAVELKTVNEGDIQVVSVEGDFEVTNVNGGIEMKNIRGSGDVYTVNGKLTAEFDKNPDDNCSFGTINGDIRLYFEDGLSADFYMKTMNGEAFTDFDVDPLPHRYEKSNSRNGSRVYKIGHTSGIRAGNGGPEIDIHTLNGDMFILNK